MTVLDESKVVARNTTGALVFTANGDAGVGERDVLHLSTVKCTEETLVVDGPVDADAANGVALTVEVASEVMGSAFVIVGSDGGEVALTLAEAGVTVGDVAAQFEVGVGIGIGGVSVGTVHLLGQQVETLGAGDDVCLVGCRAVVGTRYIPEVLGDGGDVN